MIFEPEQLDVFACTIDESAGLAADAHPGAYDKPEPRRRHQLTELPGTSFEDIFEETP